MFTSWWTIDIFSFICFFAIVIFISSWAWNKYYIARPVILAIKTKRHSRMVTAVNQMHLPQTCVFQLYTYSIVLLILLLCYQFGLTSNYTLNHFFFSNTTWTFLNLLQFFTLIICAILLVRIKNGNLTLDTSFATILVLACLNFYFCLTNYFALILLLECQGVLLLLFITANLDFFKRTVYPKSFLALTKYKHSWRINILLIQFWINFLGAVTFIILVTLLSQTLGTLHWYDILYLQPAIFYSVNMSLNVKTWLALWLLLSICIKVCAFPFHFWKPELYRNLTYPSIFIYASIYTFVLMWLTSSLLNTAYLAQPTIICFLLSLLVLFSVYFITPVFFNISDIKLFLAYTSVFHVLYILIALLADAALFEKALAYNIIYFFTNITIFSALLLIKKLNLLFLTDLQTLSANPSLLVWLIGALASMAGLPPFLGFWTKIVILLGLWSNTHFLICAHLFSSSLIIMYFYFANYRFAGATNIKNTYTPLLFNTHFYIILIGSMSALMNYYGVILINDIVNYTALVSLLS